MTEQAKRAESLALAGRSCSEAILGAYGPGLGLDESSAIKLASGLGGGMGLMGGACGALTAAYLVLGLRFGVCDAADRFARQNVYLLVQECAEAFRQDLGATACRDLCMARHSGEGAWLQKARESGSALDVVRRAAAVLDGIIEKEEAAQAGA